MFETGDGFRGLWSLAETARLNDWLETSRAKPPWTPWSDSRDCLLVSTGTGKTATFHRLLLAIVAQTENFRLAGFKGPADAPNPCDCPACAEFGAATGCTDSPNRFGQRLSFEVWKADPAAFVAPHVVALMDAPALAVAGVLDDWADALQRRTHRATDCAATPVPSFHLISPWILLLDRLLVLAWRTGAASASRRGLIRIKRRLRDSRPGGQDGTRPRCAGRAPRGPSAPRMSSVVIRGGALP